MEDDVREPTPEELKKWGFPSAESMKGYNRNIITLNHRIKSDYEKRTGKSYDETMERVRNRLRSLVKYENA